MQNRSSNDGKKHDLNTLAFSIVGSTTSGMDDEAKLVEQAKEEGKDRAAVLLGRRGGLKGGRARAAKMTSEERSEAARKAAKARWEKEKGDK